MSMKAVVHDRYGPPEVLRIEEVEPARARGTTRSWSRFVRLDGQPVGLRRPRSAKPFFSRFFTGLRRPKRPDPGMELAGEVEAVGAAVTEFEVGDEVFGVKVAARTPSTSASGRAARWRTSRPA